MPILKRNGKTFSGTPTKIDTAKSYTTFDSADDKNPTTWSDVELLTSKEEQRSLFSKISTMFKNIRYLYRMLGTTDISSIGDGTVTGGLDALNAKFVWTILFNAQTDAWGNLHIDKLEKYIPISVVACSEYVGMLYQKSSYEWFIHFMTDNQNHTIASNFTFANLMVLWIREPN